MKSDQAFLADLDRSPEAVKRIEQMLCAKGEWARARSINKRPDAAARHRYSDAGDIHLTRRVEVKHRKLDFTREEDFPYDTVLIDECYHVERDNVPPLDRYYIVNAALTHYACVTTSTRKFWRIETRFDAHQGRTCDFFALPKGLAIWGAL